MKKKLIAASGPALCGALLLAGCVQKQPDEQTAAGNALTVSSTADACEVSAATAMSGNVTFAITNDGPQTTEFYLSLIHI